jgi:hypothetical protein
MGCKNGYSWREMKVDITQLLVFFDELMPDTNEEVGIYSFRGIRSDGFNISFTILIYEAKVLVTLENSEKGKSGLQILASLYFKNCSEINVLDEKLKCLEILHENGKGRCFLTLLGDAILDYSDEDTLSRQD